MQSARAAVISAAPDPEDAGLRFDRLADNVPALTKELSEDELAILQVACGRAPYLATLLGRDPDRLARVAEDPYLRREKPRDALAESLRSFPADDEDQLMSSVRQWRADEMVRLGVRELGFGEAVAVGHELAHMAEVAFDAAIEFWDRQLTERFGPPRYTDDEGVTRNCELTVIGMGKLGGQELNFNSDVDVIYVYSSDAGQVGDRSLHEYYADLCRKVTATIATVTADEFVFRVDLRLRPEGSRGAIANSLPSTERYYEAWGRPWERQAWLKARPCAGSLELGDEVMKTLEPFIYPRSTSPTVIDEVTELNRRIKAELDSSGIDAGFDLKNGVGGIREVEFFTQALQLVHAGRRPELRARATRDALDQLLFAGLITDTEHRELINAYQLLRRLEHGLQLESGRQTQRLPTDPRALERFARRMGFDDVAGLTDALKAATEPVARSFATLGDDEEGPSADVLLLLGDDVDDDRLREALKRLGFRDLDQALHNLAYGRRRPLSPLGGRARGAAARVAPGLLAEIAASPDPDQALSFLVDLIGRRGSWSSLWRLFDDNPPTLRLVCSLMGTSAFLSRLFVNHPELIDRLLQRSRASSQRDADELRAELTDRLRPIADDDEGAHWDTLAELKQGQVLRIGLADIAGDLDPADVCAELSTVAEVCLEQAFDMVVRSMRTRHGQPPALAVLGLGKLGSRELGYASDLDIIFVHADEADVVYATRLAQRLVSALHTMHRGGRLYEADTRLRPDGSRGLLVSSLTAWKRYHSQSARLWERQALIKLRPVAGDKSLGATVQQAARRVVYAGDEQRDTLVAEIRTMRAKIEQELGGGASQRDLKAGRGGLIDVEFAAQFLQLAHGATHPELRTRATVSALRAAAAAQLAEPTACEALVDGYNFLRALEHRVRIVHDRSERRLPTDEIELAKLARRLQYPDGAALVASFDRWANQIRSAFEVVVSA